jgi:cellobiose-specific phosphotransferase system component IIA
MKHLFVILLSVGVLASCNNSGNAEQRVKDSLDSLKNLKVESVQNAANQAIDTIEKQHDSINKRIDNVADQTRDSLKK